MIYIFLSIACEMVQRADTKLFWWRSFFSLSWAWCVGPVCCFSLVKMLFTYKKPEGLWWFVPTKQMIQLDFCHSFLLAFAYCDKSFLETTLAPWFTGDYLFNINNAPVFWSHKHIHIMMFLLIMHPLVYKFQCYLFGFQHILCSIIFNFSLLMLGV